MICSKVSVVCRLAYVVNGNNCRPGHGNGRGRAHESHCAPFMLHRVPLPPFSACRRHPPSADGFFRATTAGLHCDKAKEDLQVTDGIPLGCRRH